MNHIISLRFFAILSGLFISAAIFSCGEKSDKDGEGDSEVIIDNTSDTTGTDSVKNASLRTFADPNENDTAKVYAFLESMFAASLKNNYNKVGPMIAYVGMDSTRIMDSYDISKPKELDNVKMTMEAINLWLTDKSIYYFDDTWIESVQGYKFIVQEVVFGYNSYYFIIFDRGDKLLLSNISLEKPALNQVPL